MEHKVKIIYNNSPENQEREAQRLKEKYEHDLATDISRRIQNLNAKHVQSMLEFGLPIQSVAEIMKLSVEEVNELSKMDIL